MTTDEWLTANLATAPPLSQAQLAILQPIFRPVIDTINNAAPASPEAT
jgi:hypothetical protein